MIKQSIILLTIFLFSFHTASCGRWKIVIPVIIIGNWMHHRLDRMERIQLRTYAATRGISESQAAKEYPEIGLIAATVQLSKDLIKTIQEAIEVFNTQETREKFKEKTADIFASEKE